MLEVTFKYDGEQPIFETLRGLQFKYSNDGNYILSVSELAYTAQIHNDAINKKLILQFSKELSFEQYKHLHKIILKITNNLEAKVDDHLALMGYLADGKEAFIFHSWNHWVQFLEGAKHISMEGQKVQVYDNQLLVAEGILVEALKDDLSNEDFQIIKCTIITKSGEKSVLGKNLKIIPTGEF